MKVYVAYYEYPYEFSYVAGCARTLNELLKKLESSVQEEDVVNWVDGDDIYGKGCVRSASIEAFYTGRDRYDIFEYEI
jgi:hypothetical protein